MVRVKINENEPMIIIMPPTRVIKPSSLPINRDVK
jgi:hypothetical protein